ncbi:cytochrome C [Sphingobium sufflavum]|uniref:cytochrome C n=1 Tax=Sphingobium sufflavum TaxID=1129547 RepID=UPI001F319B8E|nr:cytochrome C [Sphingobium sufflavum]MCE7796062.1 cytochrome C [Sphingobium sufflavum]
MMRAAARRHLRPLSHRAHRLAPLAAALILCAGSLGASGAAWSLTYTPAPETVPAILSDEGAQAVVAQCSGCHSLDYLTTQPRGKGAQFWRDSVNKMIAVYGAPIAPADIDALTALLDARLGKAG